MSNFKYIDLKVGIYDCRAEITRHANGDVTIRDPYIEWVNGTGFLSYCRYRFKKGSIKQVMINSIFSSNPPKISYYDSTCNMSYGDFASENFN